MNSRPRLFSIASIVTATVVGSFAAGVWTLYLNYRALGKPVLAKKTLQYGGLLFAALMLISAFLPPKLWLGLTLMLVQAGGTYALALALQGPAIAHHQTNGGTMHSPLTAVGVGLGAGLIMLILLIFLAILGGVPPASA